MAARQLFGSSGHSYSHLVTKVLQLPVSLNGEVSYSQLSSTTSEKLCANLIQVLRILGMTRFFRACVDVLDNARSSLGDPAMISASLIDAGLLHFSQHAGEGSKEQVEGGIAALKLPGWYTLPYRLPSAQKLKTS